MKLEPEGVLLRAARRVPDEAKDVFFADVSQRLKYLRNITPQDVAYACSAVLGELREQSELAKRRAG